MLAHCLRRWHNIKTALGQRYGFAGIAQAANNKPAASSVFTDCYPC